MPIFIQTLALIKNIMFSYKEFPEQVINEIEEFANEYQFVLFEVQEDHCVRYRNSTWELFFFCDHGAIELSIVNVLDGYSYSITDILSVFFPDSIFYLDSAKHAWGSLRTVRFKIDALKKHYWNINKIYPQNKDKLWEKRNRSWILTRFIRTNGSKELKIIYEPSNDLWLEKASIEYSNYYTNNNSSNNTTRKQE
jgi:hypothetical protein